jgi:GMP synthase (glutamine-hydrolysing)
MKNSLKIFVVDNGGQWTHREWRVLRDLGVETKIIPNNVPLQEIDADGLVLSGGAARINWETLNLGKISEYLDEAKFPILGICLGHQFMALHFKGTVSPSATPEFGKMQVDIKSDSPIFKGLPRKFIAWESHNDEIQTLPKGFEITASSQNCRIQAMHHVSKPLYGLQFHPEVEDTEFGEDIFKNFVEICEKHKVRGSIHVQR